MMKRKPLSTFNLDSYLFVAFKRIWTWAPVRKQALSNAFIKSGPIIGHKCASCGIIFPLLNVGKRKKKQVHVDHISPVVDPKTGFIGWDIYLSRLFTQIENLQVLCVACHKIKTKKENELRYAFSTGNTSEASRKKISVAHKGHTRLVGIPKTIQHKLAMSLERKGKPQTQARINALTLVHLKQKVPVTAYTLNGEEIETFSSITDAGLKLNIHPTNISRVCLGQRKAAGNLYFNYTNENERRRDGRI